MSFYQLGICQ